MNSLLLHSLPILLCKTRRLWLLLHLMAFMCFNFPQPSLPFLSKGFIRTFFIFTVLIFHIVYITMYIISIVIYHCSVTFIILIQKIPITSQTRDYFVFLFLSSNIPNVFLTHLIYFHHCVFAECSKRISIWTRDSQYCLH